MGSSKSFGGQSADAFLSKTVAGGGELWTSSEFIFDQLNKEDPNRWRDNEPPYTGRFKTKPLMVGGRLYVNMPTSVGAAIDARTGKTIWIYNPKTYEAGTTTMSAGGTNDGPQLIARDKATGEAVASLDLPRGALGTPMTYMLNGKQYIALTVGGDPVPELIAFTLPE